MVAALKDEPETVRRDPPDGTQAMQATVVRPDAPAQAGTGGAPGLKSVIKDRFVLEKQIGQGGMGIVFAALDRRKVEAQDPNPWVALKVLNPEFARHQQAFVSLQREARKAQTLAHPNVATVYDFDRDGDFVYVTMELLLGRTLNSVTQGARGTGIERGEAWRIIQDIASGLAYAHRRGIVHADLKPGNVFLREDGHAKILDFGIARAVPSADATAAAYEDNFDAGVLGALTPAYATPEMMARADPHPSDDLYALGLIACELLAGRHPFQGTSSVEARRLGMRPELPKGLTRRQSRALQKCLALERKSRPANAGEFLRLLKGITAVQKGLIVATAVLALAAGYFGYSTYQEAGPAEPFAQLPPLVQQQFTSFMHDGNELLQFYRKDNNLQALQEAVDQYDAAYKLHPRNRDASAALHGVADAALKAAQGDAERQKLFARMLAEHSEYLGKYGPVKALLQ